MARNHNWQPSLVKCYVGALGQLLKLYTDFEDAKFRIKNFRKNWRNQNLSFSDAKLYYSFIHYLWKLVILQHPWQTLTKDAALTFSISSDVRGRVSFSKDSIWRSLFRSFLSANLMSSCSEPCASDILSPSFLSRIKLFSSFELSILFQHPFILIKWAEQVMFIFMNNSIYTILVNIYI